MANIGNGWFPPAQGVAFSIVAWQWDFGDGGTSTLQNPTHVYAAAGTYTVSLTATSSDGAVDTETKIAYVTVTLITTNTTVIVDGTGFLDLAGGSAEVTVTNDELVVVSATGILELDGGTATQVNQRNVTIPEPGLSELVCGPTIICGQHVVGESSTGGDRYVDYTLDLDGDTVSFTFDNTIVITVERTYELQLDGVKHVIVNPVLMPSPCLDLDLAAVICTPLDLAEITTTSLDLDELVCLEA